MVSDGWESHVYKCLKTSTDFLVQSRLPFDREVSFKVEHQREHPVCVLSVVIDQDRKSLL